MRSSSSVRPESPATKVEDMQVNTEIQIAPIGTSKLPSTPLVLPGRSPKNGVGGADDFSLPSPRAQVVELPGISTINLPMDDMADGKDDEDDPYPLYHLKGRNLIEPIQVECSRTSLNSGDVFVADMRKHPLYCVIQWTGYDANRREKSAGRGFSDKLVNEVGLSSSLCDLARVRARSVFCMLCG